MFVTIQELARTTGLPERTLRRAAGDGSLPSRRIGRRRIFVLVEDAERFAGAPIVKTTATTARAATTDSTHSTAA